MRYSILLTICCCYCLAVNAQEPDSALQRKKLSPSLLYAKATVSDNKPSTWWIVVTDTERFKSFLADHKLAVKVIGEYSPTRLLVVQTTRKLLMDTLLQTPWVVFAD